MCTNNKLVNKTCSGNIGGIRLIVINNEVLDVRRHTSTLKSIQNSDDAEPKYELHLQVSENDSHNFRFSEKVYETIEHKCKAGETRVYDVLIVTHNLKAIPLKMIVSSIESTTGATKTDFSGSKIVLKTLQEEVEPIRVQVVETDITNK